MVGGKKQKKEAENSRGVRKLSQIPIKARKEPNQLYISSRDPNPGRQGAALCSLCFLHPPHVSVGGQVQNAWDQQRELGGRGGHRGKADSSSSHHHRIRLSRRNRRWRILAKLDQGLPRRPSLLEPTLGCHIMILCKETHFLQIPSVCTPGEGNPICCMKTLTLSSVDSKPPFNFLKYLSV